jgi:predicted ATP-grasp superfamily ATP-dependent carboligase
MARPQTTEELRAMRVLVVGLSTRAAAESAARAGFAVTAIDAFGDRDQHPSVRGLSLVRDFGVRFSPGAAARAGRKIACDVVAYASSFENHPRAVKTLAGRRGLWGNAPAVLRRVRDPLLVAEALRRRRMAVPAIRMSMAGRDVHDGRAGSKRQAHRRRGPRWLAKPLASGGGRGVRPWPSGTRPPRRVYLQELIDGTPGSVAFVAAGGRAVPLGVSRQLIGDAAFGASGYHYCGNILFASGDAAFAMDDATVELACGLAGAVAEEFGVVGVNGVDFVVRDGVPYGIEVNPRWCASMELVEHAYDLSVFWAHATACAVGALPEFDLARARRGASAVGKAIVFARRAVTVGDTRPWLADPSVRDVPHPGERINAGGPVCTLLAAGRNAVACHASLVQRAKRIYAELAVWERSLARPLAMRVGMTGRIR